MDLITCPRCRRKCGDTWLQCPDCGCTWVKPPDRGSSMRTLFELRGRAWLVRSLVLVVLGVIAYAVTRQVMP